MKRTKHFYQTHLRQQSFGIVIYFICVQWIFTVSAFVDAAAVAAGVAVEDKVTLPSRNEATNPLKEPTPSTLQGAFLGGNLTDANNGSTSTPPADAPQRRRGAASVVIASTTAASTTAAASVDEAIANATSTPAAAAETVWNARTAAVATLPADSRRNESAATATGPDPAATNRPLESWENVVHTSTEQPSSSQSSSSQSQSQSSPTTTAETARSSSSSDYGPATDLDNKNLVANMLKSWFNLHKDDSTAAAVDGKGYYRLATEYLRNNNGAAAGVRDGGGGGPSSGIASPSAGKGVATADAAAAAVVVAGNKNLFERWDEASEEQERVLEDAMRSEGPGSSSSSSSSVLAADQNTPSRWFVLLLSGNSTVAQMRRTDFAKYLKLNLAARLSLEYDEVKINRVLVVPPRLMVNVSVVPVSERASAAAAAVAAVASSSSSSSRRSLAATDTVAAPGVPHRALEEDDPLHNLVETNATLMELSGEEYRVERFMSLKSQKPQSMEEAAAVVSDRHADIDFFIYATVGPLCFVVVLGFLLLTLYKYVRKHPVQWPWKRKFRQPSFWPGADCQHRHRRMTDECGGGRVGDCASPSAVDELGGGTVNVIYSGEFEQSQQQQLSGSWLDDASFVPDDSLDRIRTPTLLRTTAAPPPAVKNKTFTDMLQQCGDGGGGGGDGADDGLQPHHHHLGQPQHRHHRGHQQHHHHHHHASSRDGQCAAAAAVHAQSPRLSRDNKLRILGCKQSCLLLPAVQPVAAAVVIVDDAGEAATDAIASACAAATTTAGAHPPSPLTSAECEDDRGQP